MPLHHSRFSAKHLRAERLDSTFAKTSPLSGSQNIHSARTPEFGQQIAKPPHVPHNHKKRANRTIDGARRFELIHLPANRTCHKPLCSKVHVPQQANQHNQSQLSPN
ncbi:hypothetical protein RB5464 [Rhodopirellula baltica SH 1]|uniref:Uncharacterized protein n=1 Tax=Rhodopirellula baltica (strain DSM 10527 / NCIMB 13988 / SH1) TaxID=243090 RepID=Q7URT3_RHOBA|nr:hypothetical protein RB5464 [Rhodopirellula baltica SH 1]